MAEAVAPPSTAQLPPPPQTNAGAPGYDGNQTTPANPSHMPPPPLHIPQNTNPIPTAITSPMSGVDGSGLISPGSGGPFARRAAPEPNKRALYVGGLDPRVTEDVLRQIFETTGHVQNVKIIPDKNVGSSRGYAAHSENRTLTVRLNRRRASITVSWSMTTQEQPRELCRH
jgi:nucleolysin TIA-1/TIAR